MNYKKTNQVGIKCFLLIAFSFLFFGKIIAAEQIPNPTAPKKELVQSNLDEVLDFAFGKEVPEDLKKSISIDEITQEKVAMAHEKIAKMDYRELKVDFSESGMAMTSLLWSSGGKALKKIVQEIIQGSLLPTDFNRVQIHVNASPIPKISAGVVDLNEKIRKEYIYHENIERFRAEGSSRIEDYKNQFLSKGYFHNNIREFERTLPGFLARGSANLPKDEVFRIEFSAGMLASLKNVDEMAGQIYKSLAMNNPKLFTVKIDSDFVTDAKILEKIAQYSPFKTQYSYEELLFINEYLDFGVSVESDPKVFDRYLKEYEEMYKQKNGQYYRIGELRDFVSYKINKNEDDNFDISEELNKLKAYRKIRLEILAELSAMERLHSAKMNPWAVYDYNKRVTKYFSDVFLSERRFALVRELTPEWKLNKLKDSTLAIRNKILQQFKAHLHNVEKGRGNIQKEYKAFPKKIKRLQFRMKLYTNSFMAGFYRQLTVAGIAGFVSWAAIAKPQFAVSAYAAVLSTRDNAINKLVNTNSYKKIEGSISSLLDSSMQWKQEVFDKSYLGSAINKGLEQGIISYENSVNVAIFSIFSYYSVKYGLIMYREYQEFRKAWFFEDNLERLNEIEDTELKDRMARRAYDKSRNDFRKSQIGPSMLATLGKISVVLPVVLTKSIFYDLPKKGINKIRSKNYKKNFQKTAFSAIKTTRKWTKSVKSIKHTGPKYIESVMIKGVGFSKDVFIVMPKTVFTKGLEVTQSMKESYSSYRIEEKLKKEKARKKKARDKEQFEEIKDSFNNITKFSAAKPFEFVLIFQDFRKFAYSNQNKKFVRIKTMNALEVFEKVLMKLPDYAKKYSKKEMTTIMSELSLALDSGLKDRSLGRIRNKDLYVKKLYQNPRLSRFYDFYLSYVFETESLESYFKRKSSLSFKEQVSILEKRNFLIADHGHDRWSSGMEFSLQLMGDSLVRSVLFNRAKTYKSLSKNERYEFLNELTLSHGRVRYLSESLLYSLVFDNAKMILNDLLNSDFPSELRENLLNKLFDLSLFYHLDIGTAETLKLSKGASVGRKLERVVSKLDTDSFLRLFKGIYISNDKRHRYINLHKKVFSKHINELYSSSENFSSFISNLENSFNRYKVEKTKYADALYLEFLNEPKFVTNLEMVNQVFNSKILWPSGKAATEDHVNAIERPLRDFVLAQQKESGVGGYNLLIRPADAEMIHRKVIQALKSNGQFPSNSQYGEKLELWTSLSGRGVSTITDNLLKELLEVSSSEQESYLKKFAIKHGRVLNMDIRDRFALTEIENTKVYNDLLNIEFTLDSNLKDKRMHIIGDVAKLAQRKFNHMGLAYVNFLEKLTSDIGATKEEAYYLEELKTKSIRTSFSREREKYSAEEPGRNDTRVELFIELVNHIKNWKTKNQVKFLLYLRGSLETKDFPFIRTQFPVYGPERVRSMFYDLPLEVSMFLVDLYLSETILAFKGVQSKVATRLIETIINEVNNEEAKKMAKQLLGALLEAMKRTGNENFQSQVLSALISMKANEKGSVGETLRVILEQFPGVGPKIAQSLVPTGILDYEVSEALRKSQDRSLPVFVAKMYRDAEKILGPNEVDFRIIEEKGSGSMKYTYEVENLKTKEREIRQVFRRDVMNNSQLYTDILREAVGYLIEKHGVRWSFLDVIVEGAIYAVASEKRSSSESRKNNYAKASLYNQFTDAMFEVEMVNQSLLKGRMLKSPKAPGSSFYDLRKDEKILVGKKLLAMEESILFADKNIIWYDRDRHAGNYLVQVSPSAEKKRYRISPIDMGQLTYIKREHRDNIIRLFSLARISSFIGVNKSIASEVAKVLNLSSKEEKELYSSLKEFFSIRNISANTKSNPILSYFNFLAAINYSVHAEKEDFNFKEGRLAHSYADFVRSVITTNQYEKEMLRLEPNLYKKHTLLNPAESMKSKVKDQIARDFDVIELNWRQKGIITIYNSYTWIKSKITGKKHSGFSLKKSRADIEAMDISSQEELERAVESNRELFSSNAKDRAGKNLRVLSLQPVNDLSSTKAGLRCREAFVQ